MTDNHLNSRTLRAIAEALLIQTAIDQENRELEKQARKEREIRKAPAPLRRRQPKVTRLVSSTRQQRALSQTRNTIRAIYTVESQWNATPVIDDTHELTRDVGPNDPTNRMGRGTAKETGTQTGDTTWHPQRGGAARRISGQRGKRVDYDGLAAMLRDKLGQ